MTLFLQLTGGQSFDAGANLAQTPVPSGLLYLGFPGAESLAPAPALVKAGKNYATGGAGVVHGAPTQTPGAGNIQLGGANYIDSGVQETTNGTMMALVGAAVSEGNTGVIGDYDPALGFAALLVNPGTSPNSHISMAVAFDNGSGARTNIAPVINILDPTPFRVICGRFSTGVRVRVDDLTIGNNAVVATALSRFAITSGHTHRIGPMASVYTGTSTIGMAAIWNRDLSDSEMALMYTYFKTYAADFGMSV